YYYTIQQENVCAYINSDVSKQQTFIIANAIDNYYNNMHLPNTIIHDNVCCLNQPYYASRGDTIIIYLVYYHARQRIQKINGLNKMHP
ncbi:MAG: hypothetical protein MJE68_32380, partial [Proteobacteria bacterium]|nr:hypothetical protein [Pseudomonadota bacterium]